VTLDHPDLGPLRLLGNPLKFSATPVRYAKAPPRLDEDRAALAAFLADGGSAPD
jgi:formyl-CoA transferase